MKLLKSKEEKEFLKAKAEAERQAKIIAEYEKKEQQRRVKIAAIDAENNRVKVDFEFRCVNYYHNLEPFSRLVKLILDANKSVDSPGYYIKTNAKFYNLQEVIDLINKTGQPAATPPRKKEINIEELED